MLELLAPAGSFEAVTAAVQSGADAVYFGYGEFNARRNAKNFSDEEAAAAVSYCHLRGVKVFLTLNTLLTDRELNQAAEFAAHASNIGFDAVIVQDLGVARMLRQTVPDLPIHGSTQMTVHSLDGAKQCADLGMQRVVVSRELNRDQLEYICLNAPIEIETFVHGALCMCYSGQCFFSAAIGGRSGNRGLCAQPCRLQYGWNGKADSAPLSLKDLSLAGHLKDLRRMGIACLKIEGRMKRPEYVSIVTRVYAKAIREGREPTQEEMKTLSLAFSRQGFTDGYFTQQKGKKMFGVREDNQSPDELYAQARAFYQGGEQRKLPVSFYAKVCADEPVQIAVEDADGNTVHVTGDVPQKAINVPLTAEKVKEQLQRTGGTVFTCEQVVAGVKENLALPLSALNALRRKALDDLAVQRQHTPERRVLPFKPGVRYENRREKPVLTVSVSYAGQVTSNLLALKPTLIYLPLEEVIFSPQTVDQIRRAEIGVAVLLPRIVSDQERDALDRMLDKCTSLGIAEALAGTLDTARWSMQKGFQVRGDFGLGLFNSQTMKELKRLGLRSGTVSFELNFPQIRDLSKGFDIEMLAYGRFPLMITENHVGTGRTAFNNPEFLTDRKQARFPVVPTTGGRTEILNSTPLFLADKAADYQKIGLWATRLAFTTEDPALCVRIMERYTGKGSYTPNDYTRGLYYRGVD